MTSEIGDLSEFANWALENSVWDGETVDWREASDFHRKIQERIMNLLLKDSFESLALQFAWIGSRDRASVAQEINEIVNGQVVQVGFKKSASQFWKKHKKEILIGGAIVAVVTTIAVIAICSGGTAAGAAAAGGKAIDSLNDKLCRKDPPKKIQQPKPPQTQLVFNEKGASINGEFASYTDLLQNKPLDAPAKAFPETLDPPKKTWISHFLEIAQNEIDNSHLVSQGFPIPSWKPSSSFSTANSPQEVSKPHLRIGGINGMYTDSEQAHSHASYIASFVPDQKIDWVHNQTHGPIVDVGEIFTLNYCGTSPNNSKKLQENWASFHQENQDRPNAKYLQFCHSQGAIHVRNGLASSPKEIRDRVIVVAIAPGAIVSEVSCYKSFNYASRKDIVHYGEMIFTGAMDTNEYRNSPAAQKAFENHKELILLEPHSDDDSFIDHDFQSPTFREVIQKRIDEYISNNGEYK